MVDASGLNHAGESIGRGEEPGAVPTVSPRPSLMKERTSPSMLSRNAEASKSSASGRVEMND